jgi:hypothetical protein
MRERVPHSASLEENGPRGETTKGEEEGMAKRELQTTNNRQDRGKDHRFQAIDTLQNLLRIGNRQTPHLLTELS